MTQLVAVVEGQVMGRIASSREGQLSFRYEPAWLEQEGAIQLSTAMPLTFKHRLISPFLWNLLPENDAVLELWGKQYGVSPNNPFKLLLNVGEDVPGAAQLVREERLASYLDGGEFAIAWLTMDEVDLRLRTVKENAAALRLPKDVGRISLAGAQAKTALYWDGERWGVPSGRAPNSHILKPPIPGFFGIVENEHLCQNIAARYGLPAAQSSVLDLSEPVIVVTRYDRLPPAQPGGLMRRVHQEDFCQALSVLPKAKYQENGGPGVRQCVELLRRVTSSPAEDVERFIKANMFNWYIGGTVAHAKNYSLLIGAGEIRLAPLYDLSTQLPYPEQLAQNLAMKIGEHHAVAQIGLEDWRTLAKDCKLDEDQVLGWLSEMGEALPGHVSAVREQALLDGLNADVIEPLSEQLLAHVQTRLATITTRYFGGG